MPFEDEYFEGGCCISVIEHALEMSNQNTTLLLKGAINELLRVLKKGAPLVLTFDVNFGEEKRHLMPDEYATLCKLLKIEVTDPPADRIFSSDTKEGLCMGKDLAVFSVTLIKK